MQYRTLEPINTHNGIVKIGALIELSGVDALGLLKSGSIEATFKRFTVRKIAPSAARPQPKPIKQANVQPLEALEPLESLEIEAENE
jgi:hypothetical protein